MTISSACTCHLYIMPVCQLTSLRLCQIALRHAVSDHQRVWQLWSAHLSVGNCHMSLLSDHSRSASAITKTPGCTCNMHTSTQGQAATQSPSLSCPAVLSSHEGDRSHPG